MLLLGLACGPARIGQSELPLLRSSLPRASAKAVGRSALDRFGRLTRDFELELYSRLLARDGNVVVSPYAVATSLGILYGASANGTRRQLSEALAFIGDRPSVHVGFNATDLALQERSNERMRDEADKQGGSLRVHHIHRGIVSDKIELEPAFLDLLSAYYGGAMWAAAPTQRERVAINAWIAEQTEQRIHTLVPAVEEERGRGLVLAGAFLLEASWLFPFDRALTTEEDFYSPSGKLRVPMVHGTADLYIEGDGFQGVMLPYVFPQMSAIFVLPAEGRRNEIERRVTRQWLEGLLVDLVRSEHRAHVRIPRFELESTIALEPDLIEMGLDSAFSSANADLSAMSESSDRLFLDQLQHSAYFSLDEEGTDGVEAPAFRLQRPTSGARTSFVVNRPFLFFVLDAPSGQILLAGRISSPT